MTEREITWGGGGGKSLLLLESLKKGAPLTSPIGEVSPLPKKKSSSSYSKKRPAHREGKRLHSKRLFLNGLKKDLRSGERDRPGTSLSEVDQKQEERLSQEKRRNGNIRFGVRSLMS